MRNFLLTTLTFLVGTATAFAQQTLPLPSGNPPEEPGKCFAVCYIPQKFETVTEQVQTYGGAQNLVVTTPTYETYREEVMVKPASYRLVTEPATYRTVEERVLVAPAYTELTVEPAEFETVTERVLIEEGATQYQVAGGSRPTFETVTNANLYYGSPTGVPGGFASTDYGNVLDPNGRRGVDNPSDPFNPSNPNGFFNDPNSPMVASPATYATNSGAGNLFDPANPNSPFSADYVKANGLDAAQTRAAELLQQAQVGSIAPYVETEARVELDRIPRSFRTEAERIEVTPAYMTYRELPSSCETGNCLSFCLVEVPAEYQTVTRRIAEACAEGYTPASIEQGGEDYCVRLKYTPAVYGARQIMVGKPEMTQRQTEAKYRTVSVRKLVKPARTVERTVEAKYETITRRVVDRESYVRYELVPAEYKTVTRRVRTGLAGTGLTMPGGLFMASPTTYGTTRGDTSGVPATASGRAPMLLNPAAGSKLPGSVLPYTYGSGPDRAGNISAVGYAPASPNMNEGPSGLPAAYYTAGCPEGYRYDPLDGLCKARGTKAAESTTVTKNVPTAQGNFSEWREVLCPTADVAPDIRKVQRALNRAGYDAGTADGIMGARTKTALAKYQRDNDLPIGGLNMATLRALGVK